MKAGKKVIAFAILVALLLFAYLFFGQEDPTDFYLRNLNPKNKREYFHKKAVELSQGKYLLFEEVEASIGKWDFKIDLDDQRFLAFYEVEDIDSRRKSEYAVLRINPSGLVEELGVGVKPDGLETKK